MYQDYGFEIHLCDICNLNCYSCSHFAPLTKTPNFLLPEQLKENLSKINPLFFDIVYTVRLLGGEPLLNPYINELIPIFRQYFKYTIQIVTNGIKLKSMSDEFFNICKDNDIIISITKYPININYEKLEKFLIDKNVKFNIFGDRNYTWIRYIYDINNKQDINYNYNNCYAYNDWHCLQIKNTKLYICNIGAYCNILNDNFDVNFIDNEYFDLTSNFTLNDFDNWYKKPKQICKMCKIKDIQYINWKQSTRSFNEFFIK